MYGLKNINTENIMGRFILILYQKKVDLSPHKHFSCEIILETVKYRKNIKSESANLAPGVTLTIK